MNTKRFILTSIVVFVVHELLGYIIHEGILSSAYDETASLWRPDDVMQSMMWIMWIGNLMFSFIFVYIFTKGYEGKGIGEGLRYGLLIGFLMAIPMSFATYVTQPISFGLAVQWLIFGVISLSILGIICAAVYKPAAE
jgi:hypothetical protein